MTFEVTPAHQAFFDAITHGTRNLMIEAVAGSGKTSSIMEGLKKIPATESVLVLAFNKPIADELARRVPGNTAARTLNSLGHGAFSGYARGRGIGRINLNRFKTSELIDQVLEDQDIRAAFAAPVRKMVGLAKGQGLIPSGADIGHSAPGTALLADTVANWQWMIDHWAIDMPEDKRWPDPEPMAIAMARKILDEGLRNAGEIDFDDQLFMTVAYGAPLDRFDWVVIDEAQDINPVQRALIAKCMKRNGRMIAVGDPCQAIYGFRGAAADSMDKIKDQFGCQVLPLHVSYRCPKAVVAEAQKVVKHIKSHASAPDGKFFGTHKLHGQVDFRACDMVVSRTNAPLIKVCYGNIRRGIPSFVMGRDIGAGLLLLVAKLSAVGLNDLDRKLDAWAQRETAKLARGKRRGFEEKIEAVNDRAECLRVFIDMSHNIEELGDEISKMFSDQDSSRMVRLCTIHKAKGLEADRVFVLNRDAMPSKWATQPWQVKQEMNLIYVACTRAKSELHYITS